MKIAIVNDVHVGNPLERQGAVRAASHLAEGVLPHLLNHIIKQHKPDLLINLGDLIRSENRELDLKSYRQAIAHFKRVDCPIVHLLGNHELKHMEVCEVESIWEESGFHQKSYGLRETDAYALIWLGMEYNPDHRYKHRLSDIQLSWLKKILGELTKPAIIFTHCAIDDHDVLGNYFYEGFKEKNSWGFFLENYKNIQEIISSSKLVEIVVQAHLHYFHTKIIEKIPYVTCPAMGDNICGPNTEDHIPEIYSLLTLNERHFTLKAFSREYCFAGAEFVRRNAFQSLQV